MPIDPRIALSVTPMQLESPTDQMGKALQLRASHDQSRVNALKVQEAEQVQTDRAALGRAMQGGMVRKSVLERLAQEAPHLIPGVVKQFDEMDKSALELRDAKAKAVTAERSFVSGAAAKVRAHNYDPEALEITLAHIEEQFPDYAPVVAQIREQAKAGGPEAIKRIVDGMIAETPTVAADVRAEEEHDATLPGKKADSTKKQTEAVAAELSTFAQQFQATTDQAGWDAVYATLPDPLRKNFHPKRSAGSIRSAQHVGMKADEVVRAGIDQQRANETRRHNRVMESKQPNEPLEAIIGPDGAAIYVPRSQAVGKMPATNRERPSEGERNSAAFYGQMRDALTTIDRLEDKISDNEIQLMTTLSHDGIVGRMNRNELSEDAKRYYRAMMQFTEARLRPVSGAAIGPSEYDRDRMTYFKQFAETPTLAEDRKRARDGALNNLRVKSGVLAPKNDAPPTDKKPDSLGIR